MRHWILLFIVTLATSCALAQVVTPISFKYEPVPINNVTIGPLREVTEQVGITVILEKHYLILTKDSVTLKIKTGSSDAQIGDQKVQMPFRTFKIRDKVAKKDITFIPLRFLAQTFGLTIEILPCGLLRIGDSYWQLSDKKHLAVDLLTQMVYAFEGQTLVRTFRTCTGKKGYETEPGIFMTYKKVNVNHKVVGKEWGGFMYRPVYYDGCSALHGSTKMRRYRDSHGCDRLFNFDADWLIVWTPGQVPKSITGDVFWFIPKVDQIMVYIIP